MALRREQDGDVAPEAVQPWHPSNFRGIGEDVGGERTRLPSLIALIVAVLLLPALTIFGYLSHRDDPPPPNPAQQTQSTQSQSGH